jgi:hypothetical protein
VLSETPSLYGQAFSEVRAEAAKFARVERIGAFVSVPSSS